jgi:hypothetical protein
MNPDKHGLKTGHLICGQPPGWTIHRGCEDLPEQTGFVKIRVQPGPAAVDLP